MDKEKINRIMNELLRKIIEEYLDVSSLVGLHQAMSVEIVKLVKWKIMIMQSNEAMNYGSTNVAPSEREILEDLEKQLKAELGNDL